MLAARRSEPGDFRRGEHVEVGNVDEQIDGDHRQGSQNQCAWQIAARLFDFGRDHTDVIPAIVSPERAHHGGKETGHAAKAWECAG